MVCGRHDISFFCCKSNCSCSLSPRSSHSASRPGSAHAIQQSPNNHFDPKSPPFRIPCSFCRFAFFHLCPRRITWDTLRHVVHERCQQVECSCDGFIASLAPSGPVKPISRRHSSWQAPTEAPVSPCLVSCRGNHSRSDGPSHTSIDHREQRSTMRRRFVASPVLVRYVVLHDAKHN